MGWNEAEFPVLYVKYDNRINNCKKTVKDRRGADE